MAYQDIEKTVSRPAGTPSISITKNGFRLNKAAKVAFALTGFSFAKPLRDDENPNKLAIQLLKEPEKNANKFRDGELGWTDQNSGLPFGTYPVTFNEDEALLEFEAEQPEEADDSEDETPARRKKAA